MPFDELDLPQREFLREAASVGDDEVPVLACLLGDDSWTLLTSRRLVWRREARVDEVAFVDIADAIVKPEVVHAAGTKTGIRELAVVTRGGKEHTLVLEPGGPLAGFWNVLKTVARAAIAGWVVGSEAGGREMELEQIEERLALVLKRAAGWLPPEQLTDMESLAKAGEPGSALEQEVAGPKDWTPTGLQVLTPPDHRAPGFRIGSQEASCYT
jgi:hypothetical protein